MMQCQVENRDDAEKQLQNDNEFYWIIEKKIIQQTKKWIFNKMVG